MNVIFLIIFSTLTACVHVTRQKDLTSNISLRAKALNKDHSSIPIKDTTQKLSHTIKKRKIINEFDRTNNQSTRWPHKTVPYEYDNIAHVIRANSIPSQQMKRNIRKAMAHWELNTCIKFEQYDPQKHKEYKTRVVFSRRTGTCAGDVGYNYPIDETRTRNNVYMGSECTVGNIIHELGHVIGFRHEHNRKDRDDHVLINPIYTKNEKINPNYKIWDDGVPGYYDVPYDLYSIMHYSNSSMAALDPKREFLMGQRIGLSFLDKEMANIAYKCNENCDFKLNCQNGGFLGKECKCVCPEELTGQLCENFIPFKINENFIELDELDNELDCNFSNETFCKWRIDEERSFTKNWKFSEEGESPIKIDKIIKDGIELSDFGFLSLPYDPLSSGSYIYNIDDKKSIKANSKITTPPLKTSKNLTLHLSFWYILYENTNFRTNLNEASLSNKTSISVNLRFLNGLVKNVWAIEDNQGPEWHFADIIIDLQPLEFAIFFETSRDTSILSLIAIDDIKVTNSNFLKSSTRKPETTIQKLSSTFSSVIPGNWNPDSKPPTHEHSWSEWTSWSRCIGSCRYRVRYRTRVCMNQIRNKCLGKSNEFEPCASNCVAPRGFVSVVEKPELKKDFNPCGETYFELNEYKIGFIVSPNFGKMYDSNIQCNYLIKAMDGKRIRAEVKQLDIQIYKPTDSCIDKLEFRYYHLGQPGPTYCGKQKGFKIESSSNFMMLIFKSNWVQETDKKGFLIKLKTI